MKFNTMDNTSSGALITNTLALFSILASVLASPILIADTPNSLASKSSCVLGKCGLSGQCFKKGSCLGINIFDPDWSHCGICSCPGQAFGGRTDPTCVMDTDCLNVQLGNRPDPCANKGHRYGGREASADPAPHRGDDGVIDKYSTNPNIEAPANIPESIPFTNYLTSRHPQRSTIEADALEKLRKSKPESHILNERDQLMNEYARLSDDGPSGPVIPDAAMMERLRSITHLRKRENGAMVSSACGMAENGIDIDGGVKAAVDVNLKKRGGCFTVENGVIVEKRGGCESVEPDVEAAVEKRVGCFIKEDGIVYAKPNCDDPDRWVPFPMAEGDPRDE